MEQTSCHLYNTIRNENRIRIKKKRKKKLITKKKEKKRKKREQKICVEILERFLIDLSIDFLDICSLDMNECVKVGRQGEY